jgi:hypothetical protein
MEKAASRPDRAVRHLQPANRKRVHWRRGEKKMTAVSAQEKMAGAPVGLLRARFVDRVSSATVQAT